MMTLRSYCGKNFSRKFVESSGLILTSKIIEAWMKKHLLTLIDEEIGGH